MRAFDLISIVISITGLLIAFVALPAFVLAWAQASDEAKEKFRRFWAWVGHKLYRGWVYFSCLVLVSTGVWKMVEFVISNDPMTRLDVFLLMMNFMSLIVFTVISLSVIVFFQLEDKKKNLP
ncbi:hypothetical protein [Pseudomonas piscis]|uniref:hypothetical protein n=1 Tax=Pseudomonas piscis TaxID=2614538 RepID=UPI0021D5B9F5|nr:hypothetical protein [Pseudomonas piscis]MCU7647140.1 hypothetical protein [Pseudomonas piscis]